MLYYFVSVLADTYQIPGLGLFNYLSFRSAISVITSLIFSLIYGKSIICYLTKKQIGEDIRNLGLDGQSEKKGTPTMGGIIIIFSTMIPVLFFVDLTNIYIILLIVSFLWMGLIGFIDDYIKVLKKDKKGLDGKFKLLSQAMLGLLIGIIIYSNQDITIKEKLNYDSLNFEQVNKFFSDEIKSTKTTIPFIKNNEFDYADFLFFLGDDRDKYSWIIFIPLIIFLITATSNGTNLTDGLDGLATGVSIIIIGTLGLFAWISGNIIYTNYLNLIYIPNVGEIVVFISALLGSLIGFLWYNTYPAQIFMGDTGSLSIGSTIAVIAIIVRKELLMPILCGIFLVEIFSVILQVGYFKYTRKKTGVGNRVFLMAPIHHHFQLRKIHESKIVARFWIIGIVLAVLTVLTLKIR